MDKLLNYLTAGILLGLLLCTVSCSSTWHLKKAIAKDPSLLRQDTLVIRDTITYRTERVELDSVFMISKDTVTIIRDNLTVKHFIYRDSVYIFAECDTKTVYIPYEKIIIKDGIVSIQKENVTPVWAWMLLGVFLLLIIIIGLYFLSKRYKSSS